MAEPLTGGAVTTSAGPVSVPAVWRSANADAAWGPAAMSRLQLPRFGDGPGRFSKTRASRLLFGWKRCGPLPVRRALDRIRPLKRERLPRSHHLVERPEAIRCGIDAAGAQGGVSAEVVGARQLPSTCAVSPEHLDYYLD